MKHLFLVHGNGEKTQTGFRSYSFSKNVIAENIEQAIEKVKSGRDGCEVYQIIHKGKIDIE